MWQIKQVNEPIEVKITEWNTGGLLTRIEVAEFFVLFTCLLTSHKWIMHSSLLA